MVENEVHYEQHWLHSHEAVQYVQFKQQQCKYSLS